MQFYFFFSLFSASSHTPDPLPFLFCTDFSNVVLPPLIVTELTTTTIASQKPHVAFLPLLPLLLSPPIPKVHLVFSLSLSFSLPTLFLSFFPFSLLLFLVLFLFDLIFVCLLFSHGGLCRISPVTPVGSSPPPPTVYSQHISFPRAAAIRHTTTF